MKNSATISKFLTALQQNPAIAPQVRNIYGSTYSSYPSYDSRGDDSDGESAVALLSQMTGLVRLCGWSAEQCRAYDIDMEPTLPWDAFEVTATCSGSTLREFSQRVGKRITASATIFNKLTALRSLDWKCSTTFDCDSKDALSADLPNLEHIRIWSLDPSFLTFYLV